MAKQKRQNKEQTLYALLLKYLSKKSADRIMAKILKMADAGASPAKIKQAIVAMIAADCAAVTGKAAVIGTNVREQPATGIKRA